MPLFFQNAITKMLGSLQPAICHASLDDIIVKSRTHDESLANLRSVFQKIKDTRMYVKVQKLEIVALSVTYLGFCITEKGVKISREKYSAIADWAAPTTKKQLRSILGSMSFWKRFVKQYSTKTGCLYDLLKKDVKYEWDEKHQKAFECIKTALTSDPILVYPENSPLAEYTVSVDASIDAIGGYLRQKDSKGREGIICYLSRRTTENERKFLNRELEALSCVYFCWTARHYLLGKFFTLETDNANNVK